MQHERKTIARPRAPGTHAVVYRLPKPVHSLVVGKLGTFDFPAGFYLYVGSAFGPGGVKARTDRHLRRDTVKKWNVDHLKAVAVPVEVWWTNDVIKRECDWAELVGALAGAFVPARKFGAGDCRECRAHLYAFRRRPSVNAFAAAVAAQFDGNAQVYWTLVGGEAGDVNEEVVYAR